MIFRAVLVKHFGRSTQKKVDIVQGHCSSSNGIWLGGVVDVVVGGVEGVVDLNVDLRSIPRFRYT